MIRLTAMNSVAEWFLTPFISLKRCGSIPTPNNAKSNSTVGKKAGCARLRVKP